MILLIKKFLAIFYPFIFRPTKQNLAGDRDIEMSFIAANLPVGPGKALDFGNGGSSNALIATMRGFETLAVDLLDVGWMYKHPKLAFERGDILKMNLTEQAFDLVINCSTVEHVGLSGRYEVKENLEDGDLDAMRKLRTLLKPGGTMLMTVPVGQDAVFSPMCRVYGAKRLPRLIEGFEVEREEYWVKDDANLWVLVSREEALSQETYAGAYSTFRCWYGLGCFVLKRKA